MTRRSRALGSAIDLFLRAPVPELTARVASLGRRPPLLLVYAVDDPHSHLLVQALARAGVVPARIDVVGGPLAEGDPRPALRRAWALADARLLASVYRLELPGDGEPAAALVAAAQAVAVAAPRLEVLLAVGDALWRGDRDALASLARTHGALDAAATARALAASARRLRRAGHYNPAMVRAEGRWYWGIDRLWHLGQRLGVELEVQMRAAAERPVPPAACELQLFHSFRSPYAYIAVERVRRLSDRFPIDVTLRPVLPMVMRGLRVPRSKRFYIARDAAREAARHDVPFGRLCDPLGPGIERVMALVPYADEQGLALELACSVGRGAWSEALDISDERDLRVMVERAGLDWKLARERMADPSWRPRAEANRAALTALGLWGVPSLRYGPLALWGQDRLAIVEDLLQRAMARG